MEWAEGATACIEAKGEAIEFDDSAAQTEGHLHTSTPKVAVRTRAKVKPRRPASALVMGGTLLEVERSQSESPLALIKLALR